MVGMIGLTPCYYYFCYPHNKLICVIMVTVASSLFASLFMEPTVNSNLKHIEVGATIYLVVLNRCTHNHRQHLYH
jgi:hypothetical protein